VLPGRGQLTSLRQATLQEANRVGVPESFICSWLLPLSIARVQGRDPVCSSCGGNQHLSGGARREAGECNIRFKLFMTEFSLLLSSKMKLLPIAFALTLLVASTCAISCNKGAASGSTSTCVAADDGFDTCYTCKATAGGKEVTTAGSCSSTGSGVTACSSVLTGCPSPAVYKSCTTANCNSCSPASVLQASAVLLFATVAAMLL
jgi:hypothetical protein